MADTRSADHSGTTDAVWPGGSSKQGPHRVGSFATCPQLEAFGHDIHLRLVDEKPATAIGTLVHVGLAYRYGMMLPERPSWLVYPDAMTAIAICGKNNAHASYEAQRVFAWYSELWKVNTWTPLLVEHQFEVQMGNEPYTARTDLLAIENNEVILIDHKTVSKLKRSIGTEYRADRQMLTGLALARSAGYDVRRVVINALSKEYPQPQFARYDVPISAEAFARLGHDTQYYLDQMHVVRQTHPDPWNRPRNWDACVRKYGRCDYFPLCSDGVSPELLVNFVQKKH